MPPAEELYQQNQVLRQPLAKLEAQVAYLQKQLFDGGKSERMDQLQLKLTDLEVQGGLAVGLISGVRKQWASWRPLSRIEEVQPFLVSVGPFPDTASSDLFSREGLRDWRRGPESNRPRPVCFETPRSSYR